MTVSKRSLITRFVSDGGDSGKASRESIRMLDGHRCIVGYGWAVYAADLGDKFALFGDGYASDNTDVGWAGYSGQTTQHLQEIKGMFERYEVEYVVVDDRLEASEVRDGVDPRGVADVHQTEPAEGDGYLP